MLGLGNSNDYITPFLFTRGQGMKVNKPGLDFLFSKTQLPYIGDIDLSTYVSDADLKKLEYAMIKDTFVHRHECFWADNVATSFANIMISIIVGEGITVSVDDKEAEEILRKWNDEINVKHQTIEDLIADVWLDNLIDRQSLWRIFINSEDPDHLVDIQRVSMRNVATEVHPTFGWRMFVQTANIPEKLMSKNSFYRNGSGGLLNQKAVQTIIPDELSCCLYFSFFKKPPVSTVLSFMVLKRWIVWFIRKFAEKFWAPFLLAYVGDPKNGYMPQTRTDKEDALNYAVDSLRKVRSYGIGAFLATTKVDILDTKTSLHSDIYENYLELMNKQIILGLYGFIGMRETKSREYGRDIILQGLLRFVRGVREKISIQFRKLFARVVLPAYGKEGFEPIDIKINFPGINLDNIKDTVQAIEIAAKIGAFKDVNEIRKILNPLWRHIDDDLDQAELNEAKNTFMELNAPSRNEADKPQNRSKGKKEEALKREWM